MRKQWYLGLLIFIYFIIFMVLTIKDYRWSIAILAPLLCIGIYDFYQTKHSILRNFPIIGHLRFILEFIGPEIRQYFIEDDEDEKPISRELRNLIYKRAKDINDTIAFGTLKNIYAPGYTWIGHSITPIAVSEVEDRILIGGPDCRQPYLASRLNISAMSYGALSPNALMALNQGAKIGNFSHNTGEGGISQYHLQGGDLVFQIGTGYFGCRDEQGLFCPQEFAKEAARPTVKMIEIKLSQGAKPAHGGILPAAKISPEVARVRKVPMGHDVISPIAHSSFHTPIELLNFVQQLRTLSAGKPIGFKLCIGLRKQFLGICKAMLETQIYPDFICIDGAEGGSGAAPLEYSNFVGEPLESALVFAHNALVGCNLRDKIRLICAGKILTGFDMVLHTALGADICNSARGMMMALGCVQSRQCNRNTCPTGITTQNERLQYGLVVADKKMRVANYHRNTLASYLEIIGAMGLRNPSEIKPWYLKRRIDETKIQALDEIFHFIQPGELLGKEDLPKDFRDNWLRANPHAF